MNRIRRQIKPALMVIAGLCAVATVTGTVPAAAGADTSGSVQAHARIHSGAAEAHARALYNPL